MLFRSQKVKGQGHQVALLTAVLARQAAAAVGVGTCWQWETAATLPSARRRKALRRPRGEERGGGISCISWRPPPYNMFIDVDVFYSTVFSDCGPSRYRSTVITAEI